MGNHAQSSIFNPRPLLLLSVAANILLIATIAFLLHQKPTTPEPIANRPLISVAAPEASAQPVAQPFNWSQIESPDYPTYIANLRNIGCPEQTLRDIITADVASLYAQKRIELNVSDSPLYEGRWSHQEEIAMVTALLGSPTTPSLPQLAQEIPHEESPQDASAAENPILPLAFQSIDPNSLPIGEVQQTVIDSLRQRFINSLGGTNQDPSDPQYAERWQQAQPELDARLKVMLGSETYRQLQRHARSRQPGS